MKEIEKLKKEVGNKGYIHTDKLEEIGLKPSWKIPHYPEDEPIRCVYCDSDWTPGMYKIFEDSGYCETCYEEKSVVFVYCENCGKLVYEK